jgi:hypothetical protein
MVLLTGKLAIEIFPVDHSTRVRLHTSVSNDPSHMTAIPGLGILPAMPVFGICVRALVKALAGLVCLGEAA